MDLTNLTTVELKELTSKSDDKDALREISTHVGAKFSGNTGMVKLKENINQILDARIEDEKEKSENKSEAEPKENESMDPVTAALAAQNKALDEEKEEDVHVKQVKQKYSIKEMMEMDAAQVKDPTLRRNVIRTQALRLRRVKITNMDPSDAAVPSTLVTVYTKYTGKVSKIIPHDSENYEQGYHVPQIILDELETRTFNMRKEVKKRGSNFGVKEYKTVVAKKFHIEILPDLTEKELKALAASQESRGAVDRSK